MVLPQLVNTGFQVLFHSPPGVLFTFPSQYSALSVTKEYLALRGGPRSFPQGFSCLVVLWIPTCLLGFRIRGFHPLSLVFPGPFCYPQRINSTVRTPACTHAGLGSSGFARRYFRNHCCFLFLRLLRCFSSPGSLPATMYSSQDHMASPYGVSPFGNLRIDAYLLLPEAYRSLSRPSSALSAKAFPLYSSSLELSLVLFYMRFANRLFFMLFLQ